MPDVLRYSEEVVRMPIESLRVRYIPVVTPEDLWQRDGHTDMTIPYSPHVELYVHYAHTHGRPVWDEMCSLRYVKERLLRGQRGQSRWTEDYIRNHHLPKRFAIYDSIHSLGLLGRYPIAVLDQPFWLTRFGYPVPGPVGPEIWTGAGRASAAWVLGYKSIKAHLYYDANPHSGNRGKFGYKILHTQVWEETCSQSVLPEVRAALSSFGAPSSPSGACASAPINPE